MAQAFDSSGSTAVTAGTTSATVNITAAATGAWCYCWVAISTGTSTDTGAVTATGWTSRVDAAESPTTNAHYAVLRRQKQAGDTTFTFAWTTSGKGTLAWVSYTGLDGTTPDELPTIAAQSATARTAVPTPSATPTAANRWGVGFFGVRTTNSANKPITWTPTTVTERIDVDNNTAGSAPWLGVSICDTNGTVAASAQSYTSTHNASESNDGSAILFLIPASGSNVNVADTAQASLAGTRADATTIVVNVADTAQASEAGTRTEAVSVGVNVTDVAQASEAGTRTEAVTISVAIADKAQASEAGTRADATTIAVRVADVAQASEAGTLGNATTIGVAIADTASAALANTRADNVTIIGNVSQIDTTRAGVLAARQPQESVTINSVTPVTVADTSRSGVLAARQPQETVTITTSVPTPDVISVLTTQRPTSRLATVVKTFTCDQPRLTSRLVQVHVISTLSQVRSTSDLPG